MNVEDLRAQLEDDLSWRLDELRILRNTLLGTVEQPDWSPAALRTILVMQYAHLEGFARHAFGLYVEAINDEGVQPSDLKPSLFAAACIAEFEALHLPSPSIESEDGKLMRKARKQIEFVERIRNLHAAPVTIDVDKAVSMEMNFGRDVLRRTLFRLGIPDGEVSRGQLDSIEFVRNTRNDVAHGNRRERIIPGVFRAHQQKCEQFMNDLARLITTAVSQQYYRLPAVATP